jgi:hypothetical protein
MWTRLSSLYIVAGEPEIQGDGGGVHGYSTVLARFVAGLTAGNKQLTHKNYTMHKRITSVYILLLTQLHLHSISLKNKQVVRYSSQQ